MESKKAWLDKTSWGTKEERFYSDPNYHPNYLKLKTCSPYSINFIKAPH